IWIIIIFFPNWKITRKILKSFLFFIPPIFSYIFFVVASFNSSSWSVFADPQLENIARFYSMENAAGSGWVHFLVVDLFVGRWIYWQGQKKKIWTIHSLILCVFLAPVGLLSHIITAYFFDKNNNSDDDDSNLEEAKTDAAVS
ncbi:MAG: ABA4-like family protein, partial [Cyanobacteria bacterium P01_E01_bin.35]